MKGEDLSVFFNEFASVVTARGRTIVNGGIFDSPQEYIGPDGDVMVTDYELYVRTDQFGDVRMGDVVDVDNVRYRCRRDARLLDDGAMSIVGLQRLGGITNVLGTSLTTQNGAYLVTLSGDYLVTL